MRNLTHGLSRMGQADYFLAQPYREVPNAR